MDFRNAFNCLSRAHFLKAVAERVHAMYPLVQSCYHMHSSLFMHEGVLTSASGCNKATLADQLRSRLECTTYAKDCMNRSNGNAGTWTMHSF